MTYPKEGLSAAEILMLRALLPTLHRIVTTDQGVPELGGDAARAFLIFRDYAPALLASAASTVELERQLRSLHQFARERLLAGIENVFGHEYLAQFEQGKDVFDIVLSICVRCKNAETANAELRDRLSDLAYEHNTRGD